MNSSSSKWQLAAAHGLEAVTAPNAFRLRKTRSLGDTPISQQVISWLLFWPLLSLIARQAVYFTGPAPSAAAYQNGAAVAGARGSHLYLYVDMLFLLGFVLVGYRQVWASLRRNPLILALLALAACSAFWSTSPIITLQMCVQVSLCTLFACYLAGRFTIEYLMRLLIFMGVAAALLSILFVFALPSYGVFQGYDGAAWQGICDHKNTLGLSMAFLLTPVFFTSSYSLRRKQAYALLLLFLIYESQSRGAWLDTAGMLLFVAWLRIVRRLRARELAPIILMSVAIVVAILALGVYFWPMLAQSIGKDASMTGRTGIYIEVWRSIMKHPILGYGFGAFWTASNAESQRIALTLRWPNIGYAESGFLDYALETGLLGVGLLIAFIAKTSFQGIRLLRSQQYSPRIGWFLTVLLLAMLTNIDAGWFMTANTLDWVLILIACIGMHEEIRSERLVLS